MGYLLFIASKLACTDKQFLTYRNLNDKLEDGHTFESYGIGEGNRAVIRLSPFNYALRDEAYYIYVQRTEEEVFRVRIKASDTIGSLKTRLWKGRLTTTGEKTRQLEHAENLLLIDEFHCNPWSMDRPATSNFQSTTVERWV